MPTHDRTLVPAVEPADPAPLSTIEGATVWVVRSPLPDLQTAFSRRLALFGPVLGAAAAMMVPPPAEAFARAADARLVALVDELETGGTALVALAKGDPRDCDQIEGYSAAEARLSSIVSELYETRAQSMAGVVAVARALTVRFVSEDYQATGDLAANLADDILRLHTEGRLS